MKSLLKKPIFLFIINRYASYGFLFIRGIIIAKFLGTYFFGIWGFMTLVLQYLSYATFGINYAITVKLSTERNSEDIKNGLYSSSALISTLLIYLVVILIGNIFHFGGVELFPRFDFNTYIQFIVVIAALTNLQQVFTNIYRAEKKIYRIALVEIFSAVLLTLSALIFRENQLILSQLITMILSGVICLVMLIYKFPFRFHLRIDPATIKSLMKLGLPLFFYNLSFFLMTIVPRSVVSAFYSVEFLGFFTLANQISYGTLLGLQSVGWAIFPDVLSKTTESASDVSALATINSINRLYNTTCFLLVFVVILFLPLIFLYLPQFKPAIPVVTILLISQAVLASSFGYNTLAISRKKQRELALIVIGVVVIMTIISALISMLEFDPIWIALIALLGSFAYILLQVKLGSKLVQSGRRLLEDFINMYPLGIVAAILINILGSFTKASFLWSMAAFAVLVFSLFPNIKALWIFLRSKETQPKYSG